MLVVITIFALMLGCATEQSSTVEKPSEKGINPQRLLGEWVRADGGYLLNIRRVRTSGRLEATYHNPRPINVETAELRRDGNNVGVFIEMRDVGYPGSYYELVYNEEEDTLSGKYFQATQQTMYEVVFVRQGR
jgi:hypothetical protein